MYHYVRDPRPPFSAIKARDVKAFDGQLDYIARHYTVVRMQDVLAAQSVPEALPSNACVLTFDDGYREHFETVLPALQRRRWQGSFFPSVASVCRRRVLDVNKIQFVLASASDVDALEHRVCALIDEHREQFGAPDAAALRRELTERSRFDPPGVLFIKRALQRLLPRTMRSRLCDMLFREWVTTDEAAFADQLYVSVAELMAMHAADMFVGGHGETHEWLAALDHDEQAREIDACTALLDSVGVAPAERVMCYPFGSWSEVTCALLRDRGYALGLTTRVALADLRTDDLFTLPRLDTNDLPVSAESPLTEWTRQVLG